MRVLAVPESDDLLQNRLFDPPAERNRDGCLEPFRYLREFLASKDIQIDTFDLGDPAQADRIIFFDLKRFTPLFHSLEVTRPEQRVLVIWEPPAVCPINYDRDIHSLFGTVLTWNDDLVDGGKYRKLVYPVPRYPRRAPVPFLERKLLCTIISNKLSRHPDSLYAERLRAIRFFERRCPDQFDFFGAGWGKPTTKWQRLRLARVPRFASYRGPVESKQETLARYRFALCYENMRTRNGYITEKIFDAMQAGAVPVYLGAENVTDYIAPDAFIDARRFGGYEQLFQHLTGMSEQQHQGYLERISAYLDSEDFARFLPERFAQTVHEALVRPAAIPAPDPASVARGRCLVEARYLWEESRRVFANGDARGYRRMFHRLLRLEPRRALGSPGLLARYAASLLGRRSVGR